VLSVAAFTMSTCLLLGLFGMVAVGATRALVGADAPADEAAADVGAANDEADAPASTRSTRASSSRTRGASERPGRRAGGAVAPGDALRAAGNPRGGS
jgi:hypothetical protein